MADVATIDYAGLFVAAMAILGVIGNWLRTSGRTKYLTAIEAMLDTILDLVAWGQMLLVATKDGQVDQVAFEKKSTEIADHIQKIKTDLGI